MSHLVLTLFFIWDNPVIVKEAMASCSNPEEIAYVCMLKSAKTMSLDVLNIASKRSSASSIRGFGVWQGG